MARATQNRIHRLHNPSATEPPLIENGLLLGRPVHEVSFMDVSNPAVTATSYVAVHGSFDQYVIADRIGLTVEFIPHLFSPTNQRPTGQRGWFAYKRTGANVTVADAFRILRVTTAA